MANNRFQILEFLPHDLVLELIKYLSPADIANLAMVCKATFNRIKNIDNEGHNIDPAILEKYNADELYRKKSSPFFLTYIHATQKNLKPIALLILQGKKDEALASIDKNPSLLLNVIPSITLKKNAQHAGEKHVNRTLYQLALGTYDDELYSAIGERIRANYGVAVQAKQFHAQFPNGVSSKKSYRAMFNLLIKTLAEDTTVEDFKYGENRMNLATREVMQTFKNVLPKSSDVFTTGVHLDLQIVIDLIEAYDATYDKLKTKHGDHQALYWRCVFGLLEMHMSYFIAMVLNEEPKYRKNLEINEEAGFHGLMKGKGKVTRSTLLKDGTDFFDPRLGVSRYIIGGSYESRYALGGLGRRAFGLAEFCKAQINKLEVLRKQLPQPTNQRLEEESHNRNSSKCRIS